MSSTKLISQQRLAYVLTCIPGNTPSIAQLLWMHVDKDNCLPSQASPNACSREGWPLSLPAKRSWCLFGHFGIAKQETAGCTVSLHTTFRALPANYCLVVALVCGCIKLCVEPSMHIPSVITFWGSTVPVLSVDKGWICPCYNTTLPSTLPHYPKIL